MIGAHAELARHVVGRGCSKWRNFAVWPKASTGQLLSLDAAFRWSGVRSSRDPDRRDSRDEAANSRAKKEKNTAEGKKRYRRWLRHCFQYELSRVERSAKEERSEETIVIPADGK